MSEEATCVDNVISEKSEESGLSFRKPVCLFDKCTVSAYSIICFVMSMLLVVIISAATVMRYVLEMDLYGYEEERISASNRIFTFYAVEARLHGYWTAKESRA